MSPTACWSSTQRGRITYAGPASQRRDAVLTTRSTCGRGSLLPGMVDLHAHLPQLPNAGLGAGLDLLTWLERYIFPLERGFDVADRRAHRAGRLARLRAAPARRPPSCTARSTRPASTPRSGRPRRTGSGRSSAR